MSHASVSNDDDVLDTDNDLNADNDNFIVLCNILKPLWLRCSCKCILVSSNYDYYDASTAAPVRTSRWETCRLPLLIPNSPCKGIKNVFDWNLSLLKTIISLDYYFFIIFVRHWQYLFHSNYWSRRKMLLFHLHSDHWAWRIDRSWWAHSIFKRILRTNQITSL